MWNRVFVNNLTWTHKSSGVGLAQKKLAIQRRMTTLQLPHVQNMAIENLPQSRQQGMVVWLPAT
jgi:hypothetical protein